jgi:hypothetical protein
MRTTLDYPARDEDIATKTLEDDNSHLDWISDAKVWRHLK